MLTDQILWSLPLAALVLMGAILVRRLRPGGSYYAFYLLAVALLLVILSAASFLIPTRVGLPLGYRLAFISAPVVIGVLALLVLFIRQHWSLSRKAVLVMLVLIGILLLALQSRWSGDLFGTLTGLLVFLLLAWWIPQRGAGYLALLTAAGLTYLFIQNNASPPARVVGSLWPVLSFAILPLLVVVPAVLVHRAVRAQNSGGFGPMKPGGVGERIAYIALATLLLGYFAYSIYWYSIWDHTSDGLGGITLTLPGSIMAVAAGLILTYILPGWRRLSGVAFAILVPVLLNQAFYRGWDVSYHKLTEDRAARIELALERYHADQRSYPQELESLSPNYLRRIPEPVILRTVGWCYQGSQDQYRLGTFHRDYFSTPISFRLYAQAGEPPDEWSCEEMHAYIRDNFSSGFVSEAPLQ
jgi:hypothetical protein